jgi:hypothetical protein
MRKTILAAVALAALALPAKATVFNIAAPDPTSQQGNFSLAPGAGAFTDQVTFSITGPSTFTIANATNVFPNASDFITGWAASIWDSVDGIIGNGNDLLLFGPQAAQACGVTPNCQIVGGSGFLNGPSLFYAQFTGTGGGTSGYSGNISTVSAVPVPGAVWLFGSGIVGLGLLAKRRRKTAAAAVAH